VLIVETGSGAVRGSVAEEVALFAGIPYAAPPVGDLRFRPPRPATPWSGVRDATAFGNIAMQVIPEPGDDGRRPGDGYYDGAPGVSEDCLVLNVWTPAPDAGRRPVMVWIHGGGYGGGAGYGAWTDGATLAREEDVVVVSINHRLDVFGFLALDRIGGDEYAGSGNAGMLDIVAALRWVRDNIAAFGGDPGSVTVFGESGGGWKISTLLAMPAARGLFHRGIVQSGSDTHAADPASADARARHLLAQLGVAETELHRLADVPASAILEASRPGLAPDRPATIHSDGTWTWDGGFLPVADGVTLTQRRISPRAPEGAEGVPLLIGTTRDEFAGGIAGELIPQPGDAVEKAVHLGMDPDAARRIFDVYRAEEPDRTDDALVGELISDTLFLMQAIRQGEAMEGVAPVYMYLFSWGWARAGDRATHAIDVPFVFGNVVPELLGTDRDASTHALAARMRSAWAAFARTGDPSHAGLPAWPRYTRTDRATMVFDHECRLERDPRRERREILSGEYSIVV
jgi:para-nitrobenzyl esterase